MDMPIRAQRLAENAGYLYHRHLTPTSLSRQRHAGCLARNLIDIRTLRLAQAGGVVDIYVSFKVDIRMNNKLPKEGP
jgi:hypothetical protein